MIYKEYGRTGKKVSAIGFGGMRFPSHYSIEESAQVVRRASQLGINYFDTAPFYCDDKSEDIMGEAFKDMPNPFYVSTKSGIGNEPDANAVRKRIDKSLKRLGVKKINFYHMWCIMNLDHYKKVIAPGGPYWGAMKAKEEGLIDHIVVSTHANGNEIAQMIKEGYFEGVTLGYNIANFPYRQEGIEAAYEEGVGVVTMNPLGGGIIPQNQEYFNFIKENENESVIQAALRFNASHEAISVTLAGMGTIQEVEHNVKAVENLKILTSEKINQIKSELKKDMNQLCTTCQYCKKCPKDIDIPKYMNLYNMNVLKGKEKVIDRYQEMIKYKDIKQGEPLPADCIACGKCEKLCTQHLNIIDRLKWLDENIINM
ncbi:aldo/keto reductase [Vallitalea okinawensis]|uniref:aldo/keto reductase n=1 Tax=Vallitalea okinawensis TaxID=2078660 RepID=UPI000CFDEAEF|nr:aldo/keto reductase [Vallitalea okinawensis]